MESNQSNVLEKVQDIFNKYKENENKKILQIFHMTVLVIVALLSEKVNNSSITAYTLLLSFMFIALSYFFLYLTDFSNIISASYICLKDHKTDDPPEILQLIIDRYFKLSCNSRNWCLFCTIISYLLLFISIFMIFDIKSLKWYYILLFLVPSYILYKAINMYFKIVKIK